MKYLGNLVWKTAWSNCVHGIFDSSVNNLWGANFMYGMVSVSWPCSECVDKDSAYFSSLPRQTPLTQWVGGVQLVRHLLSSEPWPVHLTGNKGTFLSLSAVRLVATAAWRTVCPLMAFLCAKCVISDLEETCSQAMSGEVAMQLCNFVCERCWSVNAMEGRKAWQQACRVGLRKCIRLLWWALMYCPVGQQRRIALGTGQLCTLLGSDLIHSTDL